MVLNHFTNKNNEATERDSAIYKNGHPNPYVFSSDTKVIHLLNSQAAKSLLIRFMAVIAAASIAGAGSSRRAAAGSASLNTACRFELFFVFLLCVHAAPQMAGFSCQRKALVK